MRALIGLVVAGTIGWAGSSAAQSMHPLTGQATSFTDRVAFKVYPTNPYRHGIDVTVAVYDQNFRSVDAAVSPPRFQLASGATREVTVLVPFGDEPRRAVRICTESVPKPGRQTLIRAQICGKFVAYRR